MLIGELMTGLRALFGAALTSPHAVSVAELAPIVSRPRIGTPKEVLHVWGDPLCFHTSYMEVDGDPIPGTLRD